MDSSSSTMNQLCVLKLVLKSLWYQFLHPCQNTVNSMRAETESIWNGDLHLGKTVGAWVRQRKKLKKLNYDMVAKRPQLVPQETLGLGWPFRVVTASSEWVYFIRPYRLDVCCPYGWTVNLGKAVAWVSGNSWRWIQLRAVGSQHPQLLGEWVPRSWRMAAHYSIHYNQHIHSTNRYSAWHRVGAH